MKECSERASIFPSGQV